jgi:hypothetical protein
MAGWTQAGDLHAGLAVLAPAAFWLFVKVWTARPELRGVPGAVGGEWRAVRAWLPAWFRDPEDVLDDATPAESVGDAGGQPLSGVRTVRRRGSVAPPTSLAVPSGTSQPKNTYMTVRELETILKGRLTILKRLAPSPAPLRRGLPPAVHRLNSAAPGTANATGEQVRGKPLRLPVEITDRDSHVAESHIAESDAAERRVADRHVTGRVADCNVAGRVAYRNAAESEGRTMSDRTVTTPSPVGWARRAVSNGWHTLLTVYYANSVSWRVLKSGALVFFGFFLWSASNLLLSYQPSWTFLYYPMAYGFAVLFYGPFHHAVVIPLAVRLRRQGGTKTRIGRRLPNAGLAAFLVAVVVLGTFPTAPMVFDFGSALDDAGADVNPDLLCTKSGPAGEEAVHCHLTESEGIASVTVESGRRPSTPTTRRRSSSPCGPTNSPRSPARSSSRWPSGTRTAR